MAKEPRASYHKRDNAAEILLRKSVRWRTAAGWLVVLVLAWRHLIHPAASAYNVWQGGEPLPAVEPLNITDVLALLGLPLGGAAADRMAEGPPTQGDVT